MPVETDVLPPRYRGPRLLARGGMGEVYRATDEKLGRDVAVKVLAERYAQDEAVRSRFTREALAAARLSDEPNTVTIFDVGEWNDRPFIVMELLHGGSLEEVVSRDGKGEPGVVLGWLEEAARALDAAHARGVVHRDVKPANLLLDQDGHVHVADFGIATAAGLDSFTRPGTVLGTAGYLAPEQARGERATPASDRYGLAVVAFELLSGSRPFQADAATAEASAHVHAPVPQISRRRPELPQELDETFERALAKEPEARFPSCAAFVAALRDAFDRAAGATGTLAPTAATLDAAAPRRRGFLLPLALAGIVALLAGGIALAAVLAGSGDEQAAPPTVRTVVKTAPGTTEVVTTTAPAPTTEQPPPAPSAAELNDQGFALMQQGDYEGALPLLEQAVQALTGSGELAEAYAAYNLAFTRLQLGRCDGVPELLDRSQAIQGHRGDINKARRQYEKQCA
ncbi:MAG: protein kinase [Actinomycetota bacterium]|nr:protein kinase [Actinomycetota bacterium]